MAGSPPPNPPNKSLYVRGLREDTSQHDLRELFSRHGHVTDIYIPISYYNKRPRGFAYVAFETIEDSKRALRKLDGSSFLGREIKVEFAQGERKTPGEMRAKEATEGGGSSGGRFSDRGGRPPPRGGRHDHGGDRYGHPGGYSNGRGRSRSPPPRVARSRSPRGRPMRRTPSPRPPRHDYAEPRYEERRRYAASPPRREYNRTRTPPPEDYRREYRGGGAGRDAGNGYGDGARGRSDNYERSFDRHHPRERGTPPPEHYRGARRSVSE